MNIALIKPFHYQNASQGDYERVFATCISPAAKYEMVDIMISRQSLWGRCYHTTTRSIFAKYIQKLWMYSFSVAYELGVEVWGLEGSIFAKYIQKLWMYLTSWYSRIWIYSLSWFLVWTRHTSMSQSTSGVDESMIWIYSLSWFLVWTRYTSMSIRKTIDILWKFFVVRIFVVDALQLDAYRFLYHQHRRVHMSCIVVQAGS